MPLSPLVTVLIPAYNAEATIRRAIESAVRQSYRPIEIVVVDDASRDETARIVKSYDAPEVRLFRLQENVGECGAMNFGLQQAEGKYIAFLDADDEWLDGKLEKQISVFESSPELTLVTCGCEFVSEFGRPPYEFGLSIVSMDPHEVWRALLANTSIAKPCVVVRRSELDVVGSFDPALLAAGDQDMWIRLAASGPVGIVPEVLVRCNDTPNSLTKKYATRMADFVLPMIDRQIERNRSRLTPAEVNWIRGERYTTVGRNLYVAGVRARGAAYLLAAALRGNHIGKNLWYIITASPPSSWLKTKLPGEKGRRARLNKSRGTRQVP